MVIKTRQCIWQMMFSLFALQTLTVNALATNSHRGLGYISYDNRPIGSIEQPFIFRTFVPNLGLDADVVSHHSQGASSLKYSPNNGLLEKVKQYQPISGMPATISVNYGKALSYCWDTTECRLLYAWDNGFLDMENYWGQPEQGRRVKFGYVPHLVGQLFYKAKGGHPLYINGKAQGADIAYQGYKLVNGHPEFIYSVSGRKITVRVKPSEAKQTVYISYHSSNSSDILSFVNNLTPFKVLKQAPGVLKLQIKPNSAQTFYGYKQKEIKIDQPTAKIGELLYSNLGCIACHTIDGGKNHGPTFKHLYQSSRSFGAIGNVVADEIYLKESITEPNAKAVPDYPAGMMPPYVLDDKQVASLILYIKTLK